MLNLDADERVTPELAGAIKAAVADGGADAWEMPRLSNFCGRWMRHSGWYPDYVLRLFRRGTGRFSETIVHTRLVCEGRVKRLRPPLIHYAMPKLEDALLRIDRYSTWKAQMILRIRAECIILHGHWPRIGFFYSDLRAASRVSRRARRVPGCDSQCRDQLLSVYESLACDAPAPGRYGQLIGAMTPVSLSCRQLRLRPPIELSGDFRCWPESEVRRRPRFGRDQVESGQ